MLLYIYTRTYTHNKYIDRTIKDQIFLKSTFALSSESWQWSHIRQTRDIDDEEKEEKNLIYMISLSLDSLESFW